MLIPKFTNLLQVTSRNTSQNFTFKNVTELEIGNIINNLNTKTSSGYDQISTCMLKKIAPTTLKPLTLIINQSLHTGTFPQKLKFAKTVPIFKKGQKNNFENYRPISLLSSISKIFEKIVHEQLSSYPEISKISI